MNLRPNANRAERPDHAPVVRGAVGLGVGFGRIRASELEAPVRPANLAERG